MVKSKSGGGADKKIQTSIYHHAKYELSES